MTDQKKSLLRLKVGHIFHGKSSNGASLVCLVTAVDDSVIHARRITTQDDLKFDRYTGLERDDKNSRIDCVAPFPLDIDSTFREMDRKYQELYEMVHKGVAFDWEQIKLTPDEKRALLSIDEHVEANPI